MVNLCHCPWSSLAAEGPELCGSQPVLPSPFRGSSLSSLSSSSSVQIMSVQKSQAPWEEGREAWYKYAQTQTFHLAVKVTNACP